MNVITNVFAGDIAKLIEKNNAVSIFQGRSEAGPRALGNRSILFNPTMPNAKEYINEIKKREHWRPFAGVILIEYVHEWFDMKNLKESPFMSYAIKIKNSEKSNLISSIIHNQTCRIQTLKREQNPSLYDVIESFHSDGKNPPILGNTSFNIAGDPLVQTLEQSIDTLSKCKLEYLYLPEDKKLIYIKNT